MLSLRAHTNAKDVLSYYKVADYYLASDRSPDQVAQWQGEGAERLGLSGAVGRVEFQALLEGRLPSGQQLGTVRNGELEHRPSWDMTFSAPKSVSVMALVAGDQRLLDAHDQAVKTALGFVESRIAETRIREDGEVRRQTTGNLIIATLREDTSRAQDPQLHSHNVVMNATQSADGQWRSLDGYAFFNAQREVGQIYRNELALRAQALGYQIVQGKDGTFELAGVSKDVLEAFSSRSAQIEAALASKGLDRDSATAAQKDMLAIATRDGKKELTAEQLRGEWQTRAAELGFDGQALQAQAQREALSSPTPGRMDAAAALAVESAMAKLAERESIFTAGKLRQDAMQMAVGKAGLADIERAITRATERAQLIPREIAHHGRPVAGYTTQAGIQTESKMLAAELSGRNAVRELLPERNAHRVVAQQELKSEHPWTQGQRLAAATLLSSRNTVNAVQGYAGTAKTTTVIKILAHVAWRQDYQVIAMAPTASAAETLGEAIGKPSITVSRHLVALDGKQPPSDKPQLWIVDEASMLSAKQTAALLDGAKSAGARVLLVGDVQQLGSVEAGAAFRQLQDAGMKTVVLDEIVRQTNEHAKESVYAAIRGDAKTALAAIERGGGQVKELAEVEDRHAAMAKDYAALSPKERGRTLVLDPSRAGREQLTQAIRAELKQDGTLRGDAAHVTTLEDLRLTREDAKQAYSYQAGDQVRFRSDYANGITKGTYYTVAAVDAQRGVVQLASPNGKTIDWSPAKVGSSTVEAYASVQREVQAGDRIAWTKNDQTAGRVNGHGAEVVSIRVDGQISVKDRAGTHTLDPANAKDTHFRHDYVKTVHAAQGQTADRVMVNAESFRANLLNERSFYVAISRAREDIRVYTDNTKELTRGIEERTGEKTTALSTEQTRSSGVEREASQATRTSDASLDRGRG